MLAPLLVRGSVWLHGQVSSVSPKRKDPNALGTQISSVSSPHSGDLFNFNFQVTLALPITGEQTFSSQHKYATCITICRLVVQYAIYLLHFPLLGHDARSFGLLRNSTFLLTITSQDVLFHLLLS
jgi:hypothetical protein